MEKLHPIFLAFFLGIFILSTGCIETGSQTTSHGSSSMNVTIIEHTFLLGDEGLLTTNYDIKENLNGSTINERKALNQTQMAVILNKYLD